MNNQLTSAEEVNLIKNIGSKPCPLCNSCTMIHLEAKYKDTSSPEADVHSVHIYKCDLCGHLFLGEELLFKTKPLTFIEHEPRDSTTQCLHCGASLDEHDEYCSMCGLEHVNRIEPVISQQAMGKSTDYHKRISIVLYNSIVALVFCLVCVVTALLFSGDRATSIKVSIVSMIYPFIMLLTTNALNKFYPDDNSILTKPSEQYHAGTVARKMRISCYSLTIIAMICCLIGAALALMIFP